MPPPPQQNMSAKAQEAMGLPPGFKAYSPFPFGGMNVKNSPIAIDDNEFTWVENFILIGKGAARTAWDVAPPIYANPGVIVNYFFYTIATTYYCIVFLTNGSAVQINVETLASTTITPPSPFYDLSAPTNLPFAKPWGTQYLLICNNNTSNDFWRGIAPYFISPEALRQGREVSALDRQFAGQSTEEILTWAAKRFGTRAGIGTSFQGPGWS